MSDEDILRRIYKPEVNAILGILENLPTFIVKEIFDKIIGERIQREKDSERQEWDPGVTVVSKLDDPGEPTPTHPYNVTLDISGVAKEANGCLTIKF